MTMKEVVVRLIIDQPGWLLYPEPILPDVQSLTRTLSPRRSTARFPSLTEGETSFSSIPSCPLPTKVDPKTEGFLHMGSPARIHHRPLPGPLGHMELSHVHS